MLRLWNRVYPGFWIISSGHKYCKRISMGLKSTWLKSPDSGLSGGVLRSLVPLKLNDLFSPTLSVIAANGQVRANAA